MLESREAPIRAPKVGFVVCGHMLSRIFLEWCPTCNIGSSVSSTFNHFSLLEMGPRL